MGDQVSVFPLNCVCVQVLVQEERLRQDLAVSDDEDDDDTAGPQRKKGHQVLNAGQELQAKAAACLKEESKAVMGCVTKQSGVMLW